MKTRSQYDTTSRACVWQTDKHEMDNENTRALRPERLTESEFARGDFRALVPEGFSYEDVLKPDFWRLTAGRFRRGDLVEVLNERMNWFARLIVVAVDRPTQVLELREISFTELAPPKAAIAERRGFTAIDGGLHDGWMIVRDFDNAVMRKNLPSFEETNRIITVEYLPLTNKTAQAMQKKKSSGIG